ncbi:MAG: DUF1501 domain-containing protein [Bryobacteraceae bacterium]
MGKENENLPSFVALDANGSGGGLGGSATRAGFLPAEFQGTPFNDSEVEPEKMIPDLSNKWVDKDAQRRQLDAIQALNREHMKSFGADDYLEGRIQSMEDAYRMQFAAMDAFDVRKEHNRFATSMDPAALPTAVCSRGGWWNAACGS